MPMRDPSYIGNSHTNPTGNAVMALLAAHGVSAAEAAEALQALYRSVEAVASVQHQVGQVPLEVLSENLLSAALDATVLLAALGAPGTDLEFRVVLPRPEDKRWAGAIHESAHLIAIGLLLGWSEVEWISIEPEDTDPGDLYGVTRVAPGLTFLLNYKRRPVDDAVRATIAPRALKLAAAVLAGPYGEAASNTDSLPPFGLDLGVARGLVQMFCDQGDEEGTYRKAHALAAGVVGVARPAIVSVAEELLQRGRLSGDEAARVAAPFLDDHVHRRIEHLLRQG